MGRDYRSNYVPLSDLQDALSRGSIIQTVRPNPKKPGSAAASRYHLYRVGMTIADAIRAGVKPDDVRWDLKRSHITLRLQSSCEKLTAIHGLLVHPMMRAGRAESSESADCCAS